MKSAAWCAGLILFGGALQAQPLISDAVNYGSRIGTGLPGAGIAQGALFALLGWNLGPSPAVQATFPLPTTDGLGGVSVTITSGGNTSSAILVNASATEVDAILPSSTPLGPATITLNYGDGSASVNVNVAASAFGEFLGAGAYNVNPDGSLTLNTFFQPAQPGQTVIINGTGLGAIPSDETQSGVTDVPTANPIVWTGTVQAPVVSAGRGTCCTGLNPNFPVPQGLAAWDVIAFTVPANITGCQVSVMVQTGNTVSGGISISVSGDGTACPEIFAVNGGNPVIVSGQIKTGLVTILRAHTIQSVGGAAVDSVVDSATAIFEPVDAGPDPVPIPSYSAALQATVGSCFLQVGRGDRAIKPPPSQGGGGTAPTPLDAGPSLKITTPNVSQVLKKLAGPVYNATTVLSTIQIPGLASIVSGGPDYLQPGPYTFDNGSGGVDVGPFSITLTNPTPVKWDSMAQNTTIDRSQGVTVNWSGGDPNGVLSIVGTSYASQGTVSYTGVFGCWANVSAGTFTVPAFLTQQLPASGNIPAGTSIMVLNATIQSLVTIPGLDVTYYSSISNIGTPVSFQ